MVQLLSTAVVRCSPSPILGRELPCTALRQEHSCSRHQHCPQTLLPMPFPIKVSKCQIWSLGGDLMDSSTAGTASFFPVRNSYIRYIHCPHLILTDSGGITLTQKDYRGLLPLFFFPTHHHPQGQGSTGSPNRLTQALLLTFLLW